MSQPSVIRSEPGVAEVGMTTRTLPGYNGRPTWDAAHGGVVAPIVPGTSVWVGTLFLPNTAPETRIIKAYCSLAGGIVAAGGSAYSLHIHALSADGAAGGTALVAVPRFAGFVLNLGVGGTLRGGPPAPTEIDPPLAARTVQPAQGGELIWTPSMYGQPFFLGGGQGARGIGVQVECLTAPTVAAIASFSLEIAQ